MTPHRPISTISIPYYGELDCHALIVQAEVRQIGLGLRSQGRHELCANSRGIATTNMGMFGLKLEKRETQLHNKAFKHLEAREVVGGRHRTQAVTISILKPNFGPSFEALGPGPLLQDIDDAEVVHGRSLNVGRLSPSHRRLKLPVSRRS